MPYGKSHGDAGAGAGHTIEGKAVESGCPDYGLEIGGQIVEGEGDAVAVGEAAAAPVEADQRAMAAEERDPRLPDRASAIAFEMMDPVLYPDKGRAGATDRIGDARAVITPAEADLLLGSLHRPPPPRTRPFERVAGPRPLIARPAGTIRSRCSTVNPSARRHEGRAPSPHVRAPDRRCCNQSERAIRSAERPQARTAAARPGAKLVVSSG